MKKLVVALAFLALVAADKESRSYKGYQVFEVIPANDEQLKLLRKYDNSADTEGSFWVEPSFVNRPAELMVGPTEIDKFMSLMKSSSIKYTLVVKDVQALIDKERSPEKRTDDFDFGTYNKLDAIEKYMKLMATKYPDKVKLVSAGKSFEGRNINGLEITFKAGNPGIFLEGGIHAREWISHATVVWIINALLTSTDKEIRQLADSNNWYIFPVVNPDGYYYSYMRGGDREWRKNRNTNGGVDLNRNWGYEWSDKNPDRVMIETRSQVYPGPRAFSEMETQALSKYIQSISGKFYAYISFHSYKQYLLYPYAFTAQDLINHAQLRAIGNEAVAALKTRHQTVYNVGNVFETLGKCSGNSVDWVRRTFNIPIAYTYELRGNKEERFHLPEAQIIPSGEETLDSLVGLFKEAAKQGIPK